MNFAPTDTQRELYDHILGFARRELNTDVVARDRAHRFPRDAWDACARVGLTGLNVPAAHGGMELDYLSTAIALEALGRGCEDAGLVFSLATHLCGAVPLWKHGSEPIKARLLSDLAAGRTIGAIAVTESEAGSDAFALKCSARREGDVYVLNGEKTYVTNGPIADVIVVLASTRPEHKFMGLSAFVVERGMPGVRVGAPFEKMGLRTSPTSSMYLEDCRVPISHLLGTEGQGASVFKQTMLWERTCEFAGYVGSMHRQLETTIEYARTRTQGKTSIAKYQAISHRIVDMSIRLDAARLLLYRACWMLDQRLDGEKEASMAKIAISEAAIKSALDAVQIHGGNGIIAEYQIERLLRDAVPATITSGTSEIQRNIIGSRLGL